MRAGVEPYGPVQDTMFRALAVLRLAVLVNAIGIYLMRYSGYDHPLVGGQVMAFMALWTLFVVWAYARSESPQAVVAGDGPRWWRWRRSASRRTSRGTRSRRPCPASG